MRISAAPDKLEGMELCSPRTQAAHKSRWVVDERTPPLHCRQAEYARPSVAHELTRESLALRRSCHAAPQATSHVINALFARSSHGEGRMRAPELSPACGMTWRRVFLHRSEGRHRASSRLRTRDETSARAAAAAAKPPPPSPPAVVMIPSQGWCGRRAEASWALERPRGRRKRRWKCRWKELDDKPRRMGNGGPEFTSHESAYARSQLQTIMQRNWEDALHECIKTSAQQVRRNKVVYVVSRSSPLATPRVRRVIIPVEEYEGSPHKRKWQPQLCDGEVALSEAPPAVSARQSSPSSIDACF
ncbi:hypothetical protein AB1Y20_012391 [Prymnesium parvum]|uniref:Uncharacterized protein n=1 Tax=Prymnesium parvum TaxID=97485 RepID=A0AB34IPB0_PRYPA